MKTAPPPQKAQTQSRLILFVKDPDAVPVKTRLAHDLAEHMAAEEATALASRLYRAFVQDFSTALSDLPQGLRVAVTPAASVDHVRNWLTPYFGPAEVDYAAQAEGDLGRRMAAALEQALVAEGADRAAIVGSDAPDFPAELIDMGLSRLAVADALIGPAQDGGYYLIGFSKAGLAKLEAAGQDLERFFLGMDWSKPTVYRETLKRFAAVSIEPLALPEWNDVDRARDVNVLYRTNRYSSFKRSATFAILSELTELIGRYDMDMPTRPGSEAPYPAPNAFDDASDDA